MKTVVANHLLIRSHSIYHTTCKFIITNQTMVLELGDLNLILREREGFAGLGMWSFLVVQSEQFVIYRLMAGRGQGDPS